MLFWYGVLGEFHCYRLYIVWNAGCRSSATGCTLYGMLGAGPVLQAVHCMECWVQVQCYRLYIVWYAGCRSSATSCIVWNAGCRSSATGCTLYGMLGAGPVVLRASCGTSIPASFDTSDSYAFVRFVSNSNSQSTGFSLNFQSSTEGKYCQRQHQQTLQSVVTALTSLKVERSCLSSRGQCMYSGTPDKTPGYQFRSQEGVALWNEIDLPKKR